MTHAAKMILIDIGNSFLKWMVVDDPKSLPFSKQIIDTFNSPLARQQKINHQQKEFIYQFQKSLKEKKIFSARIVSVQSKKKIESKIVDCLNKRARECNQPIEFHFAKNESEFKLYNQCLFNGYENKDQLGTDRWLAMIAAFYCNNKGNQNQNFAVIDFGSVISFDFIKQDKKNHNHFSHLGGMLVCDLPLVLESLSFKMPLYTKLDENRKFNKNPLGVNTRECIESGFFQSIYHLLHSHPLIKEMEFIYFTGGFFLQLKEMLNLKNKAYTYHPNLVLFGLWLDTFNITNNH